MTDQAAVSKDENRRLFRKGVLAVALLAWGAVAAQADVKLPAIFSEHMVVQAEAEVPVWGWADAGEEITVSLAGQTQSTVAGADGKWKLSIGKLKDGGPHTLVVKGKNTLTVNDVLVGEVWLASGQSNMAMTVDGALNFEQEKAAANLPQVRMFNVGRSPRPQPQADCQGTWLVCDASTVGKFSAAAYFFGRELHRELKTPVGLVNSSYGGTAIEAWTSLDAQTRLPEYATISESWVKSDAEPWDPATAEKDYQTRLAQWKKVAQQARAAGKPVPRAPRKPVQSILNQNHPANLFNGMIAPIVPYAMRGAIWYQGEGNSTKPFANLYGLQLKTLIQDWRTRWGYDFPFAWVQLPDFRRPQQAPAEPSTWAVVREQMLETLAVPNTGMAIALGLGEAGDIHPRNKQGVGQRLAQWALATVYDRTGESSGPLPAGHKIIGREIVVSFTHADGGLVAKDGEVRGFTIAGSDKKFVWANALIEGDKVIVSSPDVPQPAAVRYAWADNPIWSLQNGAGLPASPFRTDDW